jgi:TolA-binding protein
MNSLKKATIVLLPLLLLNTACKTQEQIQREQIVDSMSLQMVESQKVVANTSSQIQGLEEKISALSGNLEESNQLNKVEREKQVKLFDERIAILEESNRANTEKLDQVNAKLEQQDKFIKEVLSTLKNMSKKKVTKKSKTKNRSAYDQAMFDYGKQRYTKAKPQLLKLLKSMKGKRKARVLHNLGMISYIQKKDQDAAVYFGRLFTEHSKSNYNANGLVYLARSFKRQKQNEQAKQTLEEMMNRFPKSRHIKAAKKLLKTL